MAFNEFMRRILGGFYARGRGSAIPICHGQPADQALLPLLSGGLYQISHPDQVVDRDSKGKHSFNSVTSSMRRRSEHSDCLQPPENFHHSFALTLIDRISRMPRGALHQWNLPCLSCYGRYEGSHPCFWSASQIPSYRKPCRPRGYAPFPWQFARHVDGSRSYRRSHCLRDSCIDDKTVSVLHHHMPLPAQLRFLAFGFLIESRIWIRGRWMSLVRSLLTLEINRWIYRIVCSINGIVPFFLEAFLSCPRLNRGAVYGEMLVGQESLFPGMTEDSFKKGTGNVSVKQPVSILAENRHIPNLFIQTQSDKPAEQQVVIKTVP